MLFRIPPRVKQGIEDYGRMLDKFLKGEITDGYFKGIRVPWGFYSHRGGKELMARIRVVGGILFPEQLRALGEARKRWARGDLHFTTRQDVQIHNLPYENSISLLRYLKDYELSPRGGGGNTVRNMVACPLTGICPDEVYPVYKLAVWMSEYMLNLDEAYNLPRKFKVAFSGCTRDCAFTGVNDVGVVALSSSSFKVLCGGGMGAHSAVGKVLEEEISLDEVPYVIKAVFNVFYKHGDRRNRHHNRLRFLIEDLTWEKFVELYQEEKERVKDEEYIPLREPLELPELEEVHEDIPASLPAPFINTCLIRQKQKGYWAVNLRIKNGNIGYEQAFKLSDLREEIPHLIFRVTQSQNLMLTNVPSEKLELVYRELTEIFGDTTFFAPDTLVDVKACRGATTCNLGLCNSPALCDEMVRKLENAPESIRNLRGLRIFINGCPNACGQHPVGPISLSGMVKKVYGNTVPFYKIHVGGRADMENTTLAEEVAQVPARAVPDVILKFLEHVAENSNGREPFDYMVKEGKSVLRRLAHEHSYVPPVEEDDTFYKDWGKDEMFSLDGLSKGECGAGVIEMIEADIASAEVALQKAKEKRSVQDILESIVFSARALLVVRGIDAGTEEEAIEGFVRKFVDAGIASECFRNTGEMYAGIRAGNINFEEALAFADSLLKEVKRLYTSMDPHFNFPGEKKEKEKPVEKTSEREIYDLRGTPCPINYVKAKMKLEGMPRGAELELWLDEGEPVENVPRSLEKDGQKILAIEKKGDYYSVVVKKEV